MSISTGTPDPQAPKPVRTRKARAPREAQPQRGPDIFMRSGNMTARVHTAAIDYKHPWGFIPQRLADRDPQAQAIENAQALDQINASIPMTGPISGYRDIIVGMAMNQATPGSDFNPVLAKSELEKPMELVNVLAAERRAHPRWYQGVAPPWGQDNLGQDSGRMHGFGSRGDIDPRQLMKSGVLSKAVLDVGTATNFSQITGGQSLGYVSLDTRIARGTVRPDSFTLYQMLPKSAAYQVVDYFAYVDDTGGALPGSATTGFSNVSSGTLATNAGIYALQSINLKLMQDGRAVTMALMAQNNFVDVVAQENANAALTVLGTADWMSYFGNSTLFTNQFNGLASTTPAANIFDYQQFYAANAAIQGWSPPETLYNMIYEVGGQVTSWGRFGRITHALMTPVTLGALASLVTNLLNNIVNNQFNMAPGIVVDGDLQGMRTRYGPIQFAMDAVISARDIPAQGQVRSNATTPTTTVNPSPPATVTVAASGAAMAGSNWNVGAGSPFIASGSWGASAIYRYAVAGTDVNMNESNLTWSANFTPTQASGAVLTITGPVAADAYAFRVYRTGNGTFTGGSGANSATAARWIGNVLASGSGAVTFVDQNTKIPGSENIFLLDMRESDGALDFRYLLPLTRIELFAQNLFMPWAVAAIGAIRNRIPKFHAIIANFIPDSALWNPAGPNT
jgi:hypothetical protein